MSDCVVLTDAGVNKYILASLDIEPMAVLMPWKDRPKYRVIEADSELYRFAASGQQQVDSNTTICEPFDVELVNHRIIRSGDYVGDYRYFLIPPEHLQYELLLGNDVSKFLTPGIAVYIERFSNAPCGYMNLRAYK
ncbi:hypothetical protein D6827_01955 [Candidatus Parcubacteria bacterium]|nr:MAG: hypothetical protein D6827_01955 [Candidatus Parcubacteria bacterium]